MASIKCMHGGIDHRHGSVQEVKECVGLVAAVIQYNYEPGGSAEPFHSNKLNRLNAEYGTRLHEQFEECTEQLPFDDKVTEPGIYYKDGDYYKVQESRSSGYLYAKKAYCKLTPVYSGEAGDVDVQRWSWEYAKGAIKALKASDKISAERATEFGKIYNICVNCFRELTREESMDRGYGPTCATNMGWPYDHSRKG